MTQNHVFFNARHAHVSYCRDLIEDDDQKGGTPPLPDLSPEEWALILEIPSFQIATSMKVSKQRRKKPVRRAPEQTGPHTTVTIRPTPCNKLESASELDSGPEASDDSASESGESVVEAASDVEEDRGHEAGKSSNRQPGTFCESSTTPGVAEHFDRAGSNDAQAIDPFLRSEVSLQFNGNDIEQQ